MKQRATPDLLSFAHSFFPPPDPSAALLVSSLHDLHVASVLVNVGIFEKWPTNVNAL